MKKDKKFVFGILSIILLVFTFISFTSAAEVNYCCEKTTSGAWCQNAPQEQCDSSFDAVPTSCESTSYCKLGCCFDSSEGLCLESTPQIACNAQEGTWTEDAQCDIPQCNLGCCVLADQGAFVTLTRCKQLSGFYGLEADFRRTITNELACIATAQGEDKGACVFDQDGSKSCTFTTRSHCSTASYNTDLNSTQSNASNGFYKDTLCTAEELGTECAPTQKTTIIDGKDEVYFLDNCGNIANIYDASKINDDDYWTNVYSKSESCGYGQSNAKSKTCGNCDYMEGSIGKKVTAGTGRPTYGDYICVDLGCKSQGKKHGESWCLSDTPSGNGEDAAGSRYFKEVCLFNEVITEECSDFRGEICIQDSFNDFSEAACRVNRWQDCMAQEEQEDCENTDIRDCIWETGYYFSTSEGQILKVNNDTTKGPLTPEGICLPNYPPGLQFWGSGSSTSSASTLASGSSTSMLTTENTNSTSMVSSGYGTGAVSTSTTGNSASSQCSSGNSKITLKWTREDHPAAGWFGSVGELLTGEDKKGKWECANDECKQYVAKKNWENANITEDEAKAWAESMNNICYKLGDCGGYINWVGVSTDEGYAAYLGQRRVAGSGGSEIREADRPATTATPNTNAATSNVVLDFVKSLGGK